MSALTDITSAYFAPLDTGAGRKHLPGRHDQSTHGRGRRRGNAVAQAFTRLAPADALAMQKQMLKDNPWTDEQEEALGEYSGGDYDWINGGLRDPARQAAWDDDTREAIYGRIRTVHEAMRPLPENVTVTRNTNLASYGIAGSAFTSPGDRRAGLEKLRSLEGETLQEPGFLSTSVDEDNAFPGGVILHLKVPKGTPAAYLESVSGLPNEHELLLAAGLKMTIESVDTSGERAVVHATALPYTPPKAKASLPRTTRQAMTHRESAKMSALSDPENMMLRDVAEHGDLFDDPEYRRVLVIATPDATAGKSAKTRSAMNTKTMQATGFQIKNADRGEFSAVLATLNVVDSDGDVTKPGAFDGSDFPLSAYGHKSWEGALPVGIGRVKEVGNEAILEGHFFMDTTHGRDTFLTVKRLGPLGQWSYGYDPVGHSNGMHEGKSVRFLEKLKVHEASPVLVGAGVGTRTLGTKSRGRSTVPGASRAVKGAIPSHETKTVSRAWDRTRTENAIPNDGRPSELRTVYAWVDPDGDPEMKASYSYPHHHGIGGPANLRACLMGIATLNGPDCDIPEPERKGIYDHLAGHLRDADREIPDLRTGPGDSKNRRFSDEAATVLAAVGGLIDRASDVMAMRRTKGKGMAAGTSDLLGWVSDELVRLKSLLSNPVEPETPQPDDDEVASVFAASIARLNGI